MSNIMNVNVKYLENALENGNPVIKVVPPVLRIAGGNYVIIGFEVGKEGKRRDLIAHLSETEYDRILFACSYKLPTQKAIREGQ